MMPSPQDMVRLLRRRPIQLVPADPPKPAPRLFAGGRCGICDLPELGHGRRYKAVSGWHEWRAEAPLPGWWESALVRWGDR